MTWQEEAAKLSVGEKTHIQHDCGDGRKLVVSRSDRGFSCYCYRCGFQEYAPPPPENLQDKIARWKRQRQNDDALTRSVSLPPDLEYRVREWPEAARLWLYKAGLGAREIGLLGAGYHPPSNRVFLPVLARPGGIPVFWQARALGGIGPKYLSPPVDRTKVVPMYGRAKSPTLTEDILSAFKVGLVAEGWSLLGTKLTDHVMSLLLARGAPVNVALDPDDAGQSAARKIVKQLAAYGVPVRNIVFPRDPKCMTLHDIQEILT